MTPVLASRGYYINLDRSVERRNRMEQSIRILDFPYDIERYAAKIGDNRMANITVGELGCFMSHQGVLDAAREDKITLVLEDDVYFSKNFSANYEYITALLSATKWDIAFLGQIINYDDVRSVSKMIFAKKIVGDIEINGFKNFKILNGRENYKWGTFAYLVNPASLEKIRGLLRASAADGYKLAIDNTYRALIRDQRIDAKVLFPYLAGIQPDLPTTMDERVDVKMSLHNIMTNLFVAGRSQTDARAEAVKYLSDSSIDHDAMVACRVIYERLKRST